MMKDLQQLTRIVPLLVIIILGILVWVLDLHHYLSFDRLKQHQKFLESFIAQDRLLSVFLFSILYILIVSVSIPGATFMTLLGGFLFGQWLGTATSVIAATLGASILFISVRMVVPVFFAKKFESRIKKMQVGFQKNAMSYLLFLRLIPLFPFVAVNLAAAFFQIPLRVFVVATFFGIIPGTFIYVAMGVALQEVIQQTDITPSLILEPKILWALIGFGVLLILPILYKKIGNFRL